MAANDEYDAKNNIMLLSTPTGKVHNTIYMCVLNLKPPKKTITNVKFVGFFYILERILQHVSKRPSVKLDHYSLYDRPSSSHFMLRYDLKPAASLHMNLPCFVHV